jgi:hypothetical protein
VSDFRRRSCAPRAVLVHAACIIGVIAASSLAAAEFIVAWQHDTFWAISRGRVTTSSEWKPLNTFDSIEVCKKAIFAANRALAEQGPTTDDNPILGRVTTRYVVRSPTTGDLLFEKEESYVHREFVCLPSGTNPK